jgi:hypothetical protein
MAYDKIDPFFADVREALRKDYDVRECVKDCVSRRSDFLRMYFEGSASMDTGSDSNHPLKYLFEYIYKSG